MAENFFTSIFHTVYTVIATYSTFLTIGFIISIVQKKTFRELKEKIEYEVSKTGLKAVLYGYSLGGNFVRYFLTHFVDDEWKSKYIEGAMFFVPGVGGAFSAPTYIATSNFFGPLNNQPFFKHMPSLYAMIPNFPANKNVAIINGKSIDASQIFEEIVKASEFSKNEKLIFKNKNSKVGDEAEVDIVIDETCKTLYKIHLPFLEEEIGDPNVRSLVVFNSGIPVMCGANVTQLASNKFEYEIFNCEGDGVMPSRGAEYASQHWKDVKYHDFNSPDAKFDHFDVGRSEELRNLIKDFIYKKNDSDNSPSKKTIIIIAVACAVLLVIVIIIIVVVVKKKKNIQDNNLASFSKLIEE